MEKDVVVELNKKYQKDFQWVLAIVVLTMLCIIGLLVFYANLQFVDDPDDGFIRTNDKGQLFFDTPLEEPHLEDNEVNNWLVQTITKSLSFNFVNVDTVLKEASENFLGNSYKDFLEQVLTIDHIRNIKFEKRVSMATAASASQIIDKGVNKGRYTWRIEFPMEILFKNREDGRFSDITVAALVTRVSVKDFPVGVKIAAILIEETDGSRRERGDSLI